MNIIISNRINHLILVDIALLYNIIEFWIGLFIGTSRRKAYH